MVPPHGNAGNAFVQETDFQWTNTTGAASKSIVFTSNVGSGDLLFCTVGWETASDATISSVTDTIGNTYNSLPLTANSPHEVQAFYAFSSGSGADAFTANFSGSGGTWVGMSCGEWSGPTAIDVHTEAIGNSTTPNSGSITPSASGELLIGYSDSSGVTDLFRGRVALDCFAINFRLDSVWTRRSAQRRNRFSCDRILYWQLGGPVGVRDSCVQWKRRRRRVQPSLLCRRRARHFASDHAEQRHRLL